MGRLPQKRLNAILPTYFPKALARMLQNEGIQEYRLLAGIDLQNKCLGDDNCRLTAAENVQFVRNALTATMDPHLGWRFGRQIQITSLGMLGYAMLSSNNGVTAVETLATYFQVREPSLLFKVTPNEECSDSVIVEIGEAYDFGDIRYFMMSCAVSAFDNVFRYLTNNQSIIKRVEFSCQRPGDEKSGDYLNAALVFDCFKTRLFLNSKVLSQKLPTANPDTEELAKRACAQLLDASRVLDGTVKEIVDLFMSRIGNIPTLDEAARHMAVSPRTLRRALRDGGTSYQRLLDETRSRLAIDLLKNTNKKMSEIAEDLGYTDSANFNRAFKSWTGFTPGFFRR